MQTRHRPASVRDTLSLGPSLSDKLSSNIYGLERPNCLNYKELSFEGDGIAHAPSALWHDTRKASKPMNGLNNRAKLMAPTLGCFAACGSLFDANKNSESYVS